MDANSLAPSHFSLADWVCGSRCHTGLKGTTWYVLYLSGCWDSGEEAVSLEILTYILWTIIAIILKVRNLRGVNLFQFLSVEVDTYTQCT